MDTFLTPEEIAEALKIETRTVYSWLRSGELTGSKLGRLWRVRETDFDYWVNANRSESREQQPGADIPQEEL